MGNMGLEIKGKALNADAIIKKMLKAGESSERAVVAALYQAGFKVAADAVKRAPKDLGFLRSSHYVAPPTGDENEVEIGFGVSYASEVHERPRITSPTTPGTESHFLQRALDAVLSTKLIADLAKRNIRDGVGVSAISAEAPKVPKYTGDPGGGKGK